MKNLFILLALFLTSSTFASLPDKWESLLKEIVEINSGTLNKKGIEAVMEKLAPEFEKLGFKSEILGAGQGRKVQYFKFKGAQPKVILIGHVDTVFEPTSSFQNFKKEGTWLNGPGVMDMKGGIVLMLNALSDIKDPEILKHVAVALNDDEEIGSPQSAPVLRELAKGVPYGLVYEPTNLSKNHVTTSQAGARWIDLTVKGKAAHSGTEHAKGRNACVELGRKMIELSKLTNYKKNLTVNPGVIHGGAKANIVCEEATVRFDIRFVDQKDLDRTLKAVEKIAAESKYGTVSTLKEVVRIPHLPKSATDELFIKAHSIAQKLGFKLEREHMGGASDANQLAPTGMKLLVGMGPWGHGAHSTEERMDTTSYEQRKNLSIELIKQLILQ